jgi:hypothetical protein
MKKLFFGAAPAAEAENLDHGLRQVKSIKSVLGQLFEIDEITLNVLHRFAARAHEVMMRFEIAIHPQGGSMGRDLSQQPRLDEKAQIVVDRGERHGRNATPHGGVNVLWRMVPVGSDHGLIDHLTLVGDRQTVLQGQFTELFMGEAHHLSNNNQYKPLRSLSTETLSGLLCRAFNS